MKKISILFWLLLSTIAYSQDNPIVLSVTKSYIYGKANQNVKIYCKYKTITDTITVKNDGYFRIKFNEQLIEKETVIIWSTYFERSRIPGFKKNIETEKVSYLVQSDEDALNSIINQEPNEMNDLDKVIAKISNLKKEKNALRNTTLTYKTSIWSTNFNIPLVRFNRVENDNTKHGDILVFNSIGAGLGYYLGRLERTRDDRGEIVNEEFSNSFGITLGALFSAGTGEDTKNVFAPTLNISTLDFQVGYGYELGNLSQSQRKGFFTLSYAIPLYKLFKKSYRVSRSYLEPIELSEKSQN